MAVDDAEGVMTDEHQAAAPAGEGESFGSWLRRQREVRQIELAAITELSKINIRYLEALEQDRFDLLPATIFVKGFLREYARIVGLDADEVVNFFLLASDREDLEGGIENPGRRSPGRSFGLAAVAVLVGAAILAFLLWWWCCFSGPEPEAAEEMETMAPPVTQHVPPPPVPALLPERALRVTLEFRATSWIDVHSDGERTVSELRVQGESLTVSADEEVRLQLRNVGAAEIEVNGEPFEHDVGGDGEIVITAPRAGAPD